MLFDSEALIKSLNDAEGCERFNYAEIVKRVTDPNLWLVLPSVYDWREYIPVPMRGAWESLTLETRICVFVIASEWLKREEQDWPRS